MTAKELKSVADREEKSTQFIYGHGKENENILMVSYIDKKEVRIEERYSADYHA